MLYLKIYALCICNIISSVKSIDVHTTLGTVRGKLVYDEVTGANYYSFQGIPYAEPPLGNLRFKPPVPKRAWSTLYDATKPGCVCPQTELYYSKEEMSEDCLHFNIYTPANSLGKLLPVIFVIPAGDFTLLSGNAEPVYGPQLLVQNDLVVVTVNHRLGALGFLSLCTEKLSGNAGLKDVLLALKIVNENIKRFGGDSNKITILGEGAGGAMAELLMLTNQSIGLFQQVIISAGSVLSSKYMQVNPRENAALLGRELGLDMSNDDCMIEQLKRVSAFDIVKAQDSLALKDPKWGFRNFRPFKPTVEIKCGSAIITRPPLALIAEGAIRDIPMIIGFNNHVGVELFPILRDEPELIDRLNKNFELLIPENILYPYGSVSRKKLAARIREFYFGGGEISLVNAQNYVNLISDSQYTAPIDCLVKLFKEKKISPVYYFIFTGDTELNWFKTFYNVTYPGAGLLDEAGYIYLTSVTKPKYSRLNPATKRLQNNILLNIKYFAYYGSPAPNPNTFYRPEAGKDRYHVVQNYDSIPVYHRPLPERIGFWSSVYEEYLKTSWNTGNEFCTGERVLH